MTISRLRDRLPDFQEIKLVSLMVVFPVHAWSIIVFLFNLPATLLRMTINQLVGVLSYQLVFAFLESVFVSGSIVLLAFFLPQNWLRRNFTQRGSLLVFVSVIWLLPIHLNKMLALFNPFFGEPGWAYWFILVVIYVLTLYGLFKLLARSPKFSRSFQVLIEKISVLSWFYILLDFMSVWVIIIRLISG